MTPPGAPRARAIANRGVVLRAASYTIVAAYAFFLGTFRITDSDVWWHLATGRLIAASGAIPRADPFSFTMGGAPWVSHEWLFAWILYGAQRLVGLEALVLVKAAFVACSFLALHTLVRRFAAGEAIPLAVTLVTATVAHERLYLRPETVTLGLIVATMLLIETTRSRPRALAMAAPLLVVVWINLHAGAVFGVFILAAHAVSETLQGSRVRPPRWTPLSRSAAIATLLAGAALLVNPNGWKAPLYPWTILRLERDVIVGNVEWQAPGFEPSHELFWALLACVAIGFLATWRKTRLSEVLVVVPFALLAVRSQRAIALFAIVAAPTLARILDVAVSALDERLAGGLRRRPRLDVVACGLVVALIAAPHARGFAFFDRPAAFGVGVREGMPAGACDFVDRRRPEGEMFNAHPFGGYLVWRFFPERRVFVDGRNDVYGPLFVRMRAASTTPASWNAFLAEFGVGYAILDYPKRALDRFDDVSADPSRPFSPAEWGLAYWDDWSMVYLRRAAPANRSILESSETRLIRPAEPSVDYLTDALSRPDSGADAIAEIERKLREDPNCARAHTILAMILSRRGEHAAALEHYRAAAMLRPRSAIHRYNLAVAYVKLERYADAKRELVLTSRLERNVAKTDWLLGQLREHGY